jgi:hypothetical protein
MFYITLFLFDKECAFIKLKTAHQDATSKNYLIADQRKLPDITCLLFRECHVLIQPCKFWIE